MSLVAPLSSSGMEQASPRLDPNLLSIRVESCEPLPFYWSATSRWTSDVGFVDLRELAFVCVDPLLWTKPILCNMETAHGRFSFMWPPYFERREQLFASITPSAAASITGTLTGVPASKSLHILLHITVQLSKQKRPTTSLDSNLLHLLELLLLGYSPSLA